MISESRYIDCVCLLSDTNSFIDKSSRLCRGRRELDDKIDHVLDCYLVRGKVEQNIAPHLVNERFNVFCVLIQSYFSKLLFVDLCFFTIRAK